MPAVDTLLTLLLEDTRNVAGRMAAAGFGEDEIRGAWNYARQAGYIEATGLGQEPNGTWEEASPQSLGVDA